MREHAQSWAVLFYCSSFTELRQLPNGLYGYRKRVLCRTVSTKDCSTDWRYNLSSNPTNHPTPLPGVIELHQLCGRWKHAENCQGRVTYLAESLSVAHSLQTNHRVTNNLSLKHYRICSVETPKCLQTKHHLTRLLENVQRRFTNSLQQHRMTLIRLQHRLTADELQTTTTLLFVHANVKLV